MSANLRPHGDDHCVYKKRYSAAQRRTIYPFREGYTVKLVSFRCTHSLRPVTGDRVNYDSLKETVTLSADGIDSLTDIVFNNYNASVSGIGSVPLCFFPRNAILFIDSNGKCKRYLLICFHCHAEKMYDGDWTIRDCDRKFELVQRFFLHQGLRYGTDANKMDYPEEENGIQDDSIFQY